MSGATSKIACAAAAVASGNADTVTIIVKDAAGNAVSGLITADFAFSLSGGASAGAFGIVTETTTKGTYRVTFTGTMAGTASTLTATVNGVALINKPTITVSVGAVSRSNSTAEFAAATVTSGSTDTVTIVVEDGAGNAVSGLAGSAFHLSLSGGTSAGTFGMVTETATKGTYTATFTATRAGTGSSLTATVSAVILTTKPTITVMP